MAKKILIVILLLPLCCRLHGQIPEGFVLRRDSLISAYKYSLAKVNIAGSSIMFVKEGEIMAREFYGYQDKDLKEPVTLNTLYNWGSCTKPFTAIAIMQLGDRGLPQLDEPVLAYIPEIKQCKNPFTKEITIAHLLTHTSGLPRWSPTTRLEDGIFYETDTWETFQQGFAAIELAFEPGSQYSYSNMGYDLLGILIQNITHIPFTDYVTSNILQPLQMKSSYFNFTPEQLKPYRANNYLGHKRKLYSKGKDFSQGLTNPSGGLNASVPDIIRFMNFLYCLDEEKESYQQVLKRSSVEEMIKPGMLVHGKGKKPDHTHYIGLGFHIINPERFSIVGHEGQSRGFMSSIWVNVETKTGYILAWNTTHRLPVKKDDRLFQAINEATYTTLFPLFKE